MSTVSKSAYDALLAATAKPNHDVRLSSGGIVAIRGVTIVEFIHVLRSYTKLREVLLNAIGAGSETVDPGTSAEMMDAFIDAGPEAIGTLISVAAGAGHDKAFIQAVLALGDDDLMALLLATIETTMPTGAADFFGRFAKVAARLGLLATPSQSEEAA